MSCFNHHDANAVCSCQSCNIFLCPECAIKIEQGYVCSDRCREKAVAIEQYNQATLQERKDAVKVNEVAVRNLADRKLTYTRFICLYILLALMTLASGIDRSDYSYSVTFIAIFVILTAYSVLRIRSINGLIDTLSTRDGDTENVTS